MDRIFIFLLCFCLSSTEIEITNFEVPPTVPYGTTDNVILDCVFDFENETDLEIKWFFNEYYTIYEWLPTMNEEPQITSKFKDHVDKNYKMVSDDSSSLHAPLRLINITTDLSGNYTCKVGNLNSEASETKDMIIYAVPPDGPDVTISEKTSEIICSSSGVFPGPSMTLYITANKDNHSEIILRQDEQTLESTSDGLYNVTTSLRFDPSVFAQKSQYVCELNIPEISYSVRKEEVLLKAPKVTYSPSVVHKNAAVTLTCQAEQASMYNITYRWLKNGHIMPNIRTAEWTIPSALADSRGNFTCVTTVSGSSSQSSVFLNITAPPSFIYFSPNYYGLLSNSTEISLKCRIECYPLCSVKWFENNQEIAKENRLYSIHSRTLPADIYRNDFESVESTLVWNLTNWPNQHLDRDSEPKSYTCVSESNSGNISHTTMVAPEYPPEKLSLSTNQTIDIMEGDTPRPVSCRGMGKPSLLYNWIYTPTGALVSKESILYLDRISRIQTHNYTCVGFNRHGRETIDVFFNVLYAPSCTIKLDNFEGQSAFVCTADANPEEVTFDWYDPGSWIRIKKKKIDVKLRSYLFLGSINRFRKYKCYVENFVGHGFCETFISGPVHLNLSGTTKNVGGSSALLNCQVLAGFDVEIQWYNNTEQIQNTSTTSIAISYNYTYSKYTVSTSSILTFVASKWDNGRNFKCSAKSEFIDKHQLPKLEESILLEVLYAPSVTVTSSVKIPFIEGKSEFTTLTCSYFANPLLPVNVTWYKDKELLEGVDEFSLTITDISRDDMGTYSCHIENEIGNGTSDVFLDVYYIPSVKVVPVESSVPDLSFALGNITLGCIVTEGNPSSLLKVYWYVNNVILDRHTMEHLHRLKNITVSDTDFTITLLEVEETFAANFTCKGVNNVGIGPESEPFETKITYPGIPTKLEQNPPTVLKGEKVSLKCSLDSVDSPANLTYLWLRDGHSLEQITTSTYTLIASVDAHRNISCAATTLKRSSTPAYITPNILVPPSIITKPSPYRRVIKGQSVTLTCRIECYPVCSVLWYVNEQSIQSGEVYNIMEKVYPDDISRNYFESVESNLTFSSEILNKDELVKYTCSSTQSTENGTMWAKATTLLSVEPATSN